MRAVLPLLLLGAALACADDRPSNATPAVTPVNAVGNVVTPGAARPRVDSASAWLTPERRAEEDTIFRQAAAAAWRFANRNYVEGTGLTRPFDSYSIGTMWDLASGLAAAFSAAELGLLEREEFDRRMERTLRTLSTLPLYENVGFNKEYTFDTGQPIGISRRPSTVGYGISATDAGRLLLWLRIIANRHPQHRPAAEGVVRRLALDEFEKGGYLQGRQRSRRSGRTRTFQEGRLGYEQYAARGFAAWGTEAENALNLEKNRESKTVSGTVVPADRRGNDRLTSEPFILLGLEAGWNASEHQAATSVLDAQERRARETGKLVMVSEDAINAAPDYFFYNTVLSQHGPWSLDVQRPRVRVTRPRWVSTKAAFAWHALMPRAYTRQVVDSVRRRALANGVWSAGVFESGKSTANPNINTAAVVLEAAAYRALGRPFLALGPAPSPAPGGAISGSASGTAAGGVAPAPAPTDSLRGGAQHSSAAWGTRQGVRPRGRQGTAALGKGFA